MTRNLPLTTSFSTLTTTANLTPKFIKIWSTVDVIMRDDFQGVTGDEVTIPAKTYFIIDGNSISYQALNFRVATGTATLHFHIEEN